MRARELHEKATLQVKIGEHLLTRPRGRKPYEF